MRTVRYGDTSLIVSVYTALFGLQQYIVKGVRQTSKKGQTKSVFFQPGAILELEVYHNEMKHLQFIREYQWDYIYTTVFSDVVKNAVATYMIELLQHSLKQPEANPELFYLIESSLQQLDRANDSLAANLPLFFTLHLGTELGFQIQGNYTDTTPVLDLREGNFVSAVPSHTASLTGEAARTTSIINSISFYAELESVKLGRNMRRQLLEAYQQYILLHVQDFGDLRSWKILQEILG